MRFSTALQSATVAIEVQQDGSALRAFHVHEQIAALESEFFKRALEGSFSEARRRTIELKEDPELFGFFISFIYTQQCVLNGSRHPSDYVVLLRLYCLGERLQATSFKNFILDRFVTDFGASSNLPDETLCDLLEILADELVHRPDLDPVRAQIFWMASKRLSTLQKYDRFKFVLNSGLLAQQLCLMAGNGTQTQPEKPKIPAAQRYEDESVYERSDEVSLETQDSKATGAGRTSSM